MSTFLIPLFFFATAIYLLYARYKRRRDFIETYVWPAGLLAKLSDHHPSLTHADLERVGRGLKQFFRAYLDSGFQPVAMPSQVADDLWHEMILYTRNYQGFCEKAFGRFLHHTPAAVLDPEQKASNAGLRRVWWQCCRLESIDPKTPARLPLLFALDKELAIANGFHYHPDCSRLRDANNGAAGYCGGDFSSGSVDGSTDGFGDGGGDGGDGGGCGGD